MGSLVRCLVVGEEGLYSHWSIVHFLAGFVPHALFAYLLEDVEHWISLWLLAFGACAFELVENTPGNGKWMWSWIGYTVDTYKLDTLRNSVGDILSLLLGWLVVEIVHQIAPSSTALFVLLGVAAALFVVFVYLFVVERHQWRHNSEVAASTDNQQVLVVGAIASPVGVTPANTGPRVRFVF